MAKNFRKYLGGVEFLEITWSNKLMIDLLVAGAMIGKGTSFPNLTYTLQLNGEEYGVVF